MNLQLLRQLNSEGHMSTATKEEAICHYHLNVDIQKDFRGWKGERSRGLPVLGALENDAFVKLNNLLSAKATSAGTTVDFHPSDSRTFTKNHNNAADFSYSQRQDAKQDVNWPVHCEEDSPGTKLECSSSHISDVVAKGMGSFREEYAADPKILVDIILSKHKAGQKLVITVGGLAEDYCVLNNAMGIAEELKRRREKDATIPQAEIIIVADATLGVYNPHMGRTKEQFLELFKEPDGECHKLGIKYQQSSELPEIMARPERPALTTPITFHGDIGGYQSVAATKTPDKPAIKPTLQELPARLMKAFFNENDPAHTRVAELPILQEGNVVKLAQMMRMEMLSRSTQTVTPVVACHLKGPEATRQT